MDEGYRFEQENNLIGSSRYAYCLALEQDGVIYQIVRYLPTKRSILKIIGFSTKNGYNVSGGISRLLREVMNRLQEQGIFQYKAIISVNTRINTGKSLNKIGFKFFKKNKMYCLVDNGIRYSKKHLQGHKVYEPGIIQMIKEL